MGKLARVNKRVDMYSKQIFADDPQMNEANVNEIHLKI